MPSKVFLTLKIMEFENVTLIKVVHIYVIKGTNVYYTYQYVVKMYSYLKCNAKWGIQNTKL
jgi:ABC-type uncharacterized transport system permease subunit